MINYNWNCKTVDVYPQYENHANVVHRVHWSVTGTSDTLDPEGNFYSSFAIGIQILNTDSITDFSPFTNLTNADIVSWTKAAIGTVQVNSIESDIESQINNLITPSSTTLIVG